MPRILKGDAVAVRQDAWESGIVGIIHNDFKFDNAVLDPSIPRNHRHSGLGDGHLGDPLMDLGSSLGYWVER